ncbi:acyl-CoA oxidase-domain-containing protein [Lipomyces oligophaga]|uniref:acyl-CoA oxidase-domain-containing protein n=1 Tax=Lipomyces oligophaga TaxID=45792 RepID=UPI0034CE04E5
MSPSVSQQTAASSARTRDPSAPADNSILGKGDPVAAMAAERAGASFSVRKMTYFMDGGEEKTRERERIMAEIERDPLFENVDFYDLTKDQLRERTMKKITHLVPYIINEPEDTTFVRLSLVGLVDMGLLTRTGVHYGLFFGAIRGGATPKQFSYWISQGAAELRGVAGCFCMTELGHGSNVAGLETTATFDPASDEFIINTPHVAATKWWIGGAAHTATHTICFARLIVHGKDYGVKSFVVPLRDVSTYELRTGIAIGDIGKKMGRDGIDNGWVQFTNVRIPRQYMLMRHAKVDRQGNVSLPPLEQLTYGALIGGRVSMAMDSALMSKRFVTIALRYAAVRRQFTSKKGTVETKLLDYALHQRRLLPLLAQSFAMQFAADEMRKMHVALMESLDNADASDKAGMVTLIEDLKEVFATSAGLKAFTTWACQDTIDQTRQACGGHGYSAYNGFGPAYADWVVQCTWEGDNSILTLSAGRALIQRYLQVLKGRKAPSATSYLNHIGVLGSAKTGTRKIDSADVLLEAWQAVALFAVRKAGDAYIKLTKEGKTMDEAFESCSQLRFVAAKIHTRTFMVKMFYERIKIADEELKQVLNDLFVLHALWSIENDSGMFLQAGYFTIAQMDEIRLMTDKYLALVRPQAVPLTDSFNLSDFFINSAIGRKDGNVYNNYFEQVKRQNPSSPQAPYFDKVIKPFINRQPEEELSYKELEESD